MFTFAVPNVFNCIFRAGSSLADCTIDGKWSSTGNKDSSASQDVRAVVSPPPHSTGNPDSSPYGTLSKLPWELRNMIYRNVLIAEEIITRPHRFLGPQPSIQVEDSKHVQVIDAALLRTCKAIYHDAIRILYGRNGFRFFNPSDVEDFAHLGLGSIPFGLYGGIGESASAADNAPYGRLTMIQCMWLRLSSENDGDDLQKVWSFWSDFFYPPEKQDHLVGFPALKQLVLDLRDWKLDAGCASKIRVCRTAFYIIYHLNQLPLSLGAVSPVGVLVSQEASMQISRLTCTRSDSLCDTKHSLKQYKNLLHYSR